MEVTRRGHSYGMISLVEHKVVVDTTVTRQCLYITAYLGPESKTQVPNGMK